MGVAHWGASSIGGLRNALDKRPEIYGYRRAPDGSGKRVLLFARVFMRQD